MTDGWARRGLSERLAADQERHQDRSGANARPRGAPELIGAEEVDEGLRKTQRE